MWVLLSLLTYPLAKTNRIQLALVAGGKMHVLDSDN